MAAGNYRTLVDFEQDMGTQHATSGQQEENWQPLAQQVWCQLTPLSGRELIAAQQLLSVVTHRLRLRYAADLMTPRLRAKVGERVLHIGHVLDIEERNTELEMLATEVQ